MIGFLAKMLPSIDVTLPAPSISATREVLLWVVFVAIVSGMAGTGLNVKDGWSQPDVRYRQSFVGCLAVTAALFLWLVFAW